MSKTYNELCCSLIDEFYGSFHAELFSHLVYYGRLSAPQLAQKSHLPLKQVKCGLSVLTQSRLVWHHTVSEGMSTYQANTRTIYDYLRTGRLIELVRRRFGDLAATVISSASNLGFAAVAELEADVIGAVDKEHSDIAECESYDGDSKLEQRNQVSTTIQTLMSEGYLSRVRSAHFQTRNDAKHDIEVSLKGAKSFTAAKGKKGLLEIEEKVNLEYDQRTSSDTAERGYAPDTTSAKRPAPGELNGQPDPKRKKTNGNTSRTNGHLNHTSVIGCTDSGVVVAVSFYNLIVDVRNAYLAGRATRSLGAIHSRVLASALSQVPSTRNWMPTNNEYIDLPRIQDDVNHSERYDIPNGHQPNGVHSSNGVHPHYDSNFDGDKVSYNQVDRSLALLADGEFRFLKGAFGKEWNIMKHDMDLFIRRHEILRFMGDRLASPALRIVRMLMVNGKLDEKALQEIGLLSAKDLRQTLAELKQMGYIDLQEVPREAQRQPNRTIYLWFHDPERVEKVILDSLYKSMVRLIQRWKAERAKLSSTLEKLDRSDVRGNEEDVMSIAELRVLRRWQRTEQWILGEIARLDESVILMRDL